MGLLGLSSILYPICLQVLDSLTGYFFKFYILNLYSKSYYIRFVHIKISNLTFFKTWFGLAILVAFSLIYISASYKLISWSSDRIETNTNWLLKNTCYKKS